MCLLPIPQDSKPGIPNSNQGLTACDILTKQFLNPLAAQEDNVTNIWADEHIQAGCYILIAFLLTGQSDKTTAGLRRGLA